MASENLTPESNLKLMKLETPEWAQKYEIGEDAFWLHDTWYQYAILSTERFCVDYPSVPNMFAMNSNGFLAISDSYPAPYRRLAILHEAKEFSEPLDEDSCARALEYELKQAPLLQVYDMSAYLEFRRGFFEKIIAYYEMKERDDKEDALLARLHKSRQYLEESIQAGETPASEPQPIE